MTDRGQGQGPNVVTVQGLWYGYGTQLKLPPVTVSGADDYIVYPATPTTSPLPNVVDACFNAGISWQYRSGNDTQWRDAGVSSTEMYVTLDQPSTNEPTYHTVIHISTRASHWATTPQEVVDKTWAVFQTRNVTTATPAFQPLTTPEQREAGKPLFYYKKWTTSIATTADLLRTGDGMCLAWARLFRDALEVQQLGTGGKIRRITAANPDAPSVPEGLAVHTWTQPGPRSGQAPYLWRNYLRGTDISFEYSLDAWRYVWQEALPGQAVEWKDVWDETTAPGQRGLAQGQLKNPKSLFDNHEIVRIDTRSKDPDTGAPVTTSKYYDPSYGRGPYTTLKEFEDNAFAGFYVRDIDSVKRVGFIGFRSNPTTAASPPDVREADSPAPN